MIFSFSDDEFNDVLFKTFCLCRKCFIAIFKDDSVTQTFDLFWGNGIAKRDYVGFWEMTLWGNYTVDKCSIAGSNDESFSVNIEPSCDMNQRRVRIIGKKLLVTWSSIFIFITTDIACWFVDQEGDPCLDDQCLIISFDDITIFELMVWF